jgi:hypothetical protein
MTRRFEAEARAMKPDAFDEWLEELGDVADEGPWVLVMAWMYAPVECCAYLVAQPGVWDGLVARAQYAAAHHDWSVIARRVGV